MENIAELQSIISAILYLLTALFYGLLWFNTKGLLRKLPIYAFIIAMGWNCFQLIYRWVSTNQPPFKTLFESFILLALCIAVVYIVVELVYKARVLGFPAALGALATMFFALLQSQKEPVNLPPALQSVWFVPHVVIYFFGYAAIFLGSAAAVLFLIRPKTIDLKRSDLIKGSALDLEALLDGAIRFGFVMLTIGLIMGAFWAKVAWGDYWTWDPKETWSLVSWLIFAMYLHLRYFGDWRGRKLAILVIIGFAAVMMTYLGMNLLPTADQSVHVYQ